MASFTAVQILLSLVALAAVTASTVFWIMSLVQVFTRQDLKNNRWLWLILILFLSPLAMIIYFFVENKKTLGIWSIICTLVPLVLLPYFAVVIYGLVSAAR